MSVEIGVDIGGTFTDVVLVRDGADVVHTKVPTTPRDLVLGVRRGIEKIVASGGVSAADVTRLVHGSTVATNAFLERRGAPTGIFATKGFADAIEIGRTQRRDLYGLRLEPVAPTFLARRRHRHGIDERIDADGAVVTALDEDGVRAAACELVADGVEAVAVCYLFSFVNPAHELRTRELLREEAPHLQVSLSCEVDPQFREYERVLVTTLDAYLRSAVSTYVERLDGMLDELGVPGPLQIMQSRGAIQSADAAAARPVSMLVSGLAAGVIGARFSAAEAGFDDVITLDIGGTSCDVALVEGGKPFISGRGEIGGYPLRMQLVDVNTIGAGGGSIAWIDAAGGLRVGPQSAGAEPGPAAYGRGGTEPTVTDASLVLGYLAPGEFAAGELSLDAEAAHAAVDRVGVPLGLSTVEAAAGIHTILNARMADEIRLVSVQRGYDPRQFGLVALGGGGPVHACALALELDLPRVVVPAAPGVLSAFGLLVADVELEQVVSLAGERVDEARAVEALADLDARGRDQLRRDGVPLDSLAVRHFAELRYAGQSYELTVPLPDDGTPLLAGGEAAFHRLHERLYGHGDRHAEVEVVALRTIHVLPVRAVRSAVRPGADGFAERALVAVRPAFFPAAGGFVPTPRYDRSLLPAASVVPGPCVVEQPDTTLVVHPGQQLTVHESGVLVVERPGS